MEQLIASIGEYSLFLGLLGVICYKMYGYVQEVNKRNMTQTTQYVDSLKEQLDKAEIRSDKEREDFKALAKSFRESTESFNRSVESFNSISVDIRNIQQNVEVMKHDIKELRKD